MLVTVGCRNLILCDQTLFNRYESFIIIIFRGVKKMTVIIFIESLRFVKLGESF